MLLNHWLKQATKKLLNAGIVTARLDCLVLLEDATGKDRSWLLAHPETTVQGTSLYILRGQLERRAGHEPLSYIRGKSEYYGREFMVDNHTLQPRPETETMIDLLKQIVEDESWKMENGLNIVDVGTGSGCLAITAKLEMPELIVLAVDISKECLKVAKQNASKLDAKIQFYQGNLLESLYNLKPQTSNLFAIMANLPYVPDDHTINQAAMQEPKIAIFGGVDGLDLYREMFGQIQNLEHKPLYILTESLAFQHEELTAIAQISGYKLTKVDDFIQVFELG